MDKSKEEIHHSLNLFKNSLREINMFKKLDQDENMHKLRKGRSAYKAKLVDSIIEKGTRCVAINERKGRLAQMAYLNQAGIRSQIDSSHMAFTDLERANKLELEKKDFLKKLPKK